MNLKKVVAASMIGISLLTTCGLDFYNIETAYAAQKAKKKAKKTKKSTKKQAQKSAYVHQCRKCGLIWEEYASSTLSVFGPMMGFLSQALYDNKAPNNWDCPMGGYCIWVRVKRR